MHKSSYDLMSVFVAKYAQRLNINSIKVLDFGSRDINGSYKKLFSSDRYDYVGIDIEDGENVSHVVDDSYNWGMIEDASFDIVISGQSLEHTEFFWLVFEEFKRVLKHQGLLCCIAPSAGPEHRHPFDCWRFLPDGFRALCKLVKFDVLECYLLESTLHDDGSEQWKDSILIAQNNDSPIR